MDEIFKINSFYDFTPLVMQEKENVNIKYNYSPQNRRGLFYLGHSDTSYLLKPSAYNEEFFNIVLRAVKFV